MSEDGEWAHSAGFLRENLAPLTKHLVIASRKNPDFARHYVSQLSGAVELELMASLAAATPQTDEEADEIDGPCEKLRQAEFDYVVLGYVISRGNDHTDKQNLRAAVSSRFNIVTNQAFDTRLGKMRPAHLNWLMGKQNASISVTDAGKSWFATLSVSGPISPERRKVLKELAPWLRDTAIGEE